MWCLGPNYGQVPDPCWEPARRGQTPAKGLIEADRRVHPDGPDIRAGWIRARHRADPCKRAYRGGPPCYRNPTTRAGSGGNPLRTNRQRLRIAVAPRSPDGPDLRAAGSGHAIGQTPAKGLIEADRRVHPDDPDIRAGWIRARHRADPCKRAYRGGPPCYRNPTTRALSGESLAHEPAAAMHRRSSAPRAPPMARIFVPAGSGLAIGQTPAKGLIEAARRAIGIQTMRAGSGESLTHKRIASGRGIYEESEQRLQGF
jgi:hypothetical protein